MARPHPPRKIRCGAVTLWALATLGLMVTALVLALNSAWLSAVQAEMHSGTDSAVLAAGGALVHDDQLRGSTPLLMALTDQARLQAQVYASAHPVAGVPLQLANADIEFIDDGTSPVAGLVRVTAHRTQARGNPIPLFLGQFAFAPETDLLTVATARLDREVIGFRPRPLSTIPVVPIALRSDPSGIDPGSWEDEVILGNGPDEFACDPSGGACLGPGADPQDGLDEMEVEIPLSLLPIPPLTSDGCILTIGATPLAMQVTQGISDADLAGFGGALVLGPTGTLTLTGTPVAPMFGSMDLNELVAALQGLQASGEARIWPLAQSCDFGTSTAVLHAFVVARVTEVIPPTLPIEPLRFRLQPAMRIVNTAVTDDTRLGGSAYLLPNPYVVKVRLVR